MNPTATAPDTVDAATAATAAADLAVYNTHLRDGTRHANTTAGQGLALVLLAAASAPVVLPRLPLAALIVASLTLAVILIAGVLLAAVYRPRGVLPGYRAPQAITTEAVARARDPHRALTAVAAESSRLEAIVWIKHRLVGAGLGALAVAVVGVVATAATAGIAALLG